MLSKHGAKLPSPEHRRSVSLSGLRNSTDIGLKGPILLRILEDDNSNKGASHLACSGCHLLKPAFQKSPSFMEPGCDHIGLTLPLLNVSQNGSWGLQRERERTRGSCGAWKQDSFGVAFPESHQARRLSPPPSCQATADQGLPGLCWGHVRTPMIRGPEWTRGWSQDCCGLSKRRFLTKRE